MSIVIAILMALLSTFSPKPIMRSDNLSIIHLRTVDNYVCVGLMEDKTYTLSVGTTRDCTDPDSTDIDVWMTLNCTGQYEKDSDNTINFYYTCMYFKQHTTYLSIVSNK